jgi:glycosyltransferase involved in cell wall biosynthesis
MRILVLNYEYPPLGGGAAPVCEQLCRLFAQRGHAVDVVTMGFRGLPSCEERDAVRIIRVPAWRKRQATCETPEMLSYVLSAWPRVAWRLRSKRYDIIHCHFVIPTGLLAYLATGRRGTPYVITAHGSDIPGYNPDRFKKEHHLTTPLLRRIMRRAALITAPSQYLRGLMIQACGPFDILHIPNGINLDRFEVKPKQRRILMTGRLLPRKGFQHVLAALDGVDTDYEVHIAGDGPLRSALEEQARTLKVKVVFHGWLDINSAELKDLYETSAVFCLPSERENASISLLEAMLAGMAVITSDVTGCPETVGDAGLVVPPRDAEALRAALARLLRSPEEQVDYGHKARRRVEQFFDWETIGGQYLSCFERISETRT